MFFTRLIVLLSALVLLSGCEQQHAPPLDQQLYIWQRQWTPAHDAALRDSRADFSTLRVLALQAFPQAGWRRARIDARLLKRDGRPLIAVIRLDGQLKSLDQDEVTAQIQQVLSDWQGARADADRRGDRPRCGQCASAGLSSISDASALRFYRRLYR